VSRIASSSYFILRHPEAYSWASSVAPEGVVDGVVGLDVSKTEGIKASVAWGISKKPCDCLVFSVSRCMTLGLISSVLDTWRGQCAVPAPEQGCRRGGPGHSKALEHRGERRGAPPTRFRGRSREPGISSSGMKPALSAAAPLMAGILAISGLHCEAPRGGATAHPALRLLRTASPRKTCTTCANTRELMNKLPGNRQFRASEG